MTHAANRSPFNGLMYERGQSGRLLSGPTARDQLKIDNLRLPADGIEQLAGPFEGD
jgi:hypothetical protein